MSNAAIDVIDEFLRAPDVQVRRNALTALATIGTTESVSHLVDAAFRDSDASVRDRAELELTGLPQDVSTLAVEQLTRGLNDPKTEPRVYALLARLAARGWVGFTPPPDPWPRRLRRAWQLAQTTPRPVRLNVRAALLGLGGLAVFHAIVVTLLKVIVGVSPTSEDVLTWLFLSAPLALAVTIAGLWRNLSQRFHYDLHAANALGLVHIGVAATIVAIGLVGAATLIFSPVDTAVFNSWLKVAVTGVATALAARFGTFVPSRVFEGWWDTLARILVGTILGSVTAVVGLLWSGAMGPDAVALAPNQYGMLLVNGAAGLAVATAVFDAGATGRAPYSRSIGLAALTVATVIAVGAPVWIGMQLAAATRTVDLRTVQGDPLPPPQTLPLGGLPLQIAFETTALLQASVIVNGSNTVDLEIKLLDASGNLVSAQDDPNPPALVKEIPAGRYTAIIDRFGSASSAGSVPLDRLFSVLASGGRTSGQPLDGATEFSVRVEFERPK